MKGVTHALVDTFRRRFLLANASLIGCDAEELREKVAKVARVLRASPQEVLPLVAKVPKYLDMEEQEVAAAVRMVHQVVPLPWLDFAVAAVKHPQLLNKPGFLARRILALARLLQRPHVFVGRMIAGLPNLTDCSPATLERRYALLTATCGGYPPWKKQLDGAGPQQLARMLVSD